MLEWNLKLLDFVRVLVLAVYCSTLSLIVTAGLLVNSWEFTTEGRYRAAIDTCLVFYVACKIVLYFFLLERVHQMIATKGPRRRDVVFLLGTMLNILGFSVITVFAFRDPVHSISKIDGKCYVGLPRIFTILFLSYDITMNPPWPMSLYLL